MKNDSIFRMGKKNHKEWGRETEMKSRRKKEQGKKTQLRFKKK